MALDGIPPGQIVVVNGTSGSGKSTTCELFAQRQDEFWLLYGIDHFLAATFPAKFGHHGPHARQGIHAHPIDPDVPDGPLRWSFGPKAQQAFAAFHSWIASASRLGCNVIVDHLLLTDPPILQDLARRLEGLPTLLVTLQPPYEVLERRVAERSNTKKLPVELLGDAAAQKSIERLNRLRPWFYESIYIDSPSDLAIDTTEDSPAEVCARIEARLAAGSADALQKIATRYASVPGFGEPADDR